MSWVSMTRFSLSSGTVLLVLLPMAGLAQPECDEIRKGCLDHCHYAPQNQWSSGFKCKRECTKQVEACRRGMRGYAPRYGDRGGYGYGAAPPRGAPYGYGAAPQQPAAPAPYAGADQQPAAPAAGYGQPGYPALGAQAPYGGGGYRSPHRGGYAAPRREEPYTGP